MPSCPPAIRLRFVTLAVIALNVTACTSLSSTLLHRGEHNVGWEKERHLRGVPVTLKVPTHVRVDILEVHYLRLSADKRVERLSRGAPIRKVDYQFIETEKIFTVDLKRPAAGTIDAKVTFEPEQQYFKEIQTTVVDQTISQVGELINTIAPAFLGVPTAAAQSATIQNAVKELPSVVASQIFEIDAPDFEDQLRAYLETHLNCCHDCGVVDPSVRQPDILPRRDQLAPAPRAADPPPAPGHALLPLGAFPHASRPTERGVVR